MMRFFDLPPWALSLSALIQKTIAAFNPPSPSHSPSPSDERGWLPREIVQREPFFDQMIANAYTPSEVSYYIERSLPEFVPTVDVIVHMYLHIIYFVYHLCLYIHMYLRCFHLILFCNLLFQTRNARAGIAFP